MSTFLLILKIVPWVLSALGIINGIFAGKRLKNKSALIDLKESEIHSLKKQIDNLVELQGEKNEVKRKVKKGKKNIDSVTDDELAINYAGKLSDVPKRKPRKK